MAMSRLICLFFFTVFLNFQIYLFSKLKILVLRFWKGKTGHTTIATCNSHTVPLGPLCLWQWFLNLCWYFLYFQSCNLHFWTTSPHPFPSDLFAKFSSPFQEIIQENVLMQLWFSFQVWLCVLCKLFYNSILSSSFVSASPPSPPLRTPLWQHQCFVLHKIPQQFFPISATACELVPQPLGFSNGKIEIFTT